MKRLPKWNKTPLGKNRISAIPLPLFALIFTGLGFYLGSQRELIKSVYHSSELPPSNNGISSPQSMSLTFTNGLTNVHSNVTESKDIVDTNAFRLQRIELSEEPKLYRELVLPSVRKLVERGEVKGCKKRDVKPYFDILEKIDKDPQYYEDANEQNSNQTCPVVFLFYFEGGSNIADTFFDFYSNIITKRCLNFIVSSRWIDVEGTKEMAQENGYKIIGKHYPKQDKTISQSLWDVQKEYGDDVLVSVNDLDHLLVWFDQSDQPHRYSSYTDMVRLYVYELLTTEGCSNQNVKERYVVPCTCLMEKNEKYVSTSKDGVIWSEYGITNRFHPTGNFYLNRSLALPSDGDSNYVYSIGTVYANLRKYNADIITHHKIGWRTKKVFSRARMAGVIHARSDNTIQSLTKYQHFLHNSMQQNIFRDVNATIADAMVCSVVDTHGILRNERTCRRVKEFANILSIGHQKLACLNAGYSEEHCMAELSCCLTY